MKKIVSIVLASSMLVGTVGALASCGPNIINGTTSDYEVNLNVDKNTETTLRILVPNNDGGKEKAYIEALIPGFNELFPNVTITFDQRTVSDQKYAESIANAVASDNVPDLFYTNTLFYYYLVSKNTLADLNPYYEASEEAGVFDLDADFYSAFLNMSAYEDGRYVVPRSADSVVVVYNTEIFQKAGIDPDTDPRMTNNWTWDDFVSIAQDLATYFKGAGNKEYGDCYAFQPSLEWEAVMTTFMESYGSKAFDANGNVAFDSTETEEMATMLRGLYEAGKTMCYYGAPATFTNGAVAMDFTSGGPTTFDAYPEIAGKFDFMPMPLIGDNAKIACGFAGWGISAATPVGAKRDIAWQFLNYMISAEGQMALINAGQSTPSIRMDYGEQKTWADTKYQHLNLDAFLAHEDKKVSSKFFLGHDPSCTFDIYTALQDFMQSLTTSTKSVATLIDICADDLAEAIR